MSNWIIELIYPIVLRTFLFIISLFPATSPAKKWLRARKSNVHDPLLFPKQNEKYILFFCSSTGEFELIKSLVNLFKSESDPVFIEITFFSLSGYQAVDKHNAAVDRISLCPLDLKDDVQSFFHSRHPAMVIIGSNAIWPTFLDYIIERTIPFVFVGATFVDSSGLKKLYYRLLIKYFNNAKHIFCSSKSCYHLLMKMDVNRASFSGNPRIDSILSTKNNSIEDRIIEKFMKELPLLICGSTHLPDEKILRKIISQIPSKILIVPHDTCSERIIQVQNLFPEAILYSQYTNQETKILILDENGLLKFLYKYASLVYIGGGFGRGIHNSLEASIWYCPVIFGPKYQRFEEAVYMVNHQIAHSVRNSDEFLQVIQHYGKVEDRNAIMVKMDKYLQDHLGANNQIFHRLKEWDSQTDSLL